MRNFILHFIIHFPPVNPFCILLTDSFEHFFSTKVTQVWFLQAWLGFFPALFCFEVLARLVDSTVRTSQPQESTAYHCNMPVSKFSKCIAMASHVALGGWWPKFNEMFPNLCRMHRCNGHQFACFALFIHLLTCDNFWAGLKTFMRKLKCRAASLSLACLSECANGEAKSHVLPFTPPEAPKP